MTLRFVNPKTGKAVDMDMPTSISLRAAEVIDWQLSAAPADVGCCMEGREPERALPPA